MHRRALLALLAVALGLAAAPPVDDPKPARAGRPAGPPATEPWFVDDEKVFANLMDGLADLAKQGKPLPFDKLKAKLKPGKVDVTPAKPGTRPLTPEQVYRAAVPSVFVLGSVVKDKDKPGGWLDGRYGSAWALTADGVLVTNWHMFDDLEDGEVFGAADCHGTVYPLTDFLGGDRTADVAVFRIDAKGLTPLPVAAGPAEVGSWVGVVSHPGDLFYVFTQGHVSRYSRGTTESGETERWMGVTAEFASGSSGSPVLNRYGAVVGMSAMTVTLESGAEEKPPEKEARRRFPRLRAEDPPRPKDKPKPKDRPPEKPKDAPAPLDSAVQMVVKMAVPSSAIRDVIGK